MSPSDCAKLGATVFFVLVLIGIALFNYLNYDDRGKRKK